VFDGSPEEVEELINKCKEYHHRWYIVVNYDK
jgi:hypothetical protein